MVDHFHEEPLRSFGIGGRTAPRLRLWAGANVVDVGCGPALAIEPAVVPDSERARAARLMPIAAKAIVAAGVLYT
jgi:hypothetical protein